MSESNSHPLAYKEIFKQLSDAKTFIAAVRICDAHFQKLGSGSSRIVYKVLGNLVIKLAKNPAGIAQNRQESDGHLASYDIANFPLDSDPNDKWIFTRLAKKITPGKFFQLVGIKWPEYNIALRNWENENKGRGHIYFQYPAMREKIDNNDFFQEVTSLAGDMGLSVGDLNKINSYGEVDGKIKIIDLGLTADIYKEYYE